MRVEFPRAADHRQDDIQQHSRRHDDSETDKLTSAPPNDGITIMLSIQFFLLGCQQRREPVILDGHGGGGSDRLPVLRGGYRRINRVDIFSYSLLPPDFLRSATVNFRLRFEFCPPTIVFSTAERCSRSVQMAFANTPDYVGNRATLPHFSVLGRHGTLGAHETGAF